MKILNFNDAIDRNSDTRAVSSAFYILLKSGGA